MIWPFTHRRPAPTTCAEAGRTGALVKADRERAKIRETTIALAKQIGRPDLAAPLQQRPD